MYFLIFRGSCNRVEKYCRGSLNRVVFCFKNSEIDGLTMAQIKKLRISLLSFARVLDLWPNTYSAKHWRWKKLYWNYLFVDSAIFWLWWFPFSRFDEFRKKRDLLFSDITNKICKNWIISNVFIHQVNLEYKVQLKKSHSLASLAQVLHESNCDFYSLNKLEANLTRIWNLTAKT